MAQPVFDQHPLEEYFRHTGENVEPMPGSSPDFVFQEDDLLDSDAFTESSDLQMPSFVTRAIQIVRELLQSSHPRHENSFAERFKYDVISSSLLSSSLAAPTSAVRRSFTPDLPGKLADGVDGAEREQSSISSRLGIHDQSATIPSTVGTQVSIVLLSLAVVVLSTGHLFFAMIPFAAAIYVRYVVQADTDKTTSTAQTLVALNELLSSGNVWDSAVNEAIVLIENEERSIFYGPTSPQAPSSSLRIALQSSLHTTQSQCDNVRQLLSALTDPASLSQLAEMYAPPSPVRPALSLSEERRSPLSPSSTMRPFSHPSGTWRQRTTSLPSSSTNTNKRATWNGSYAALAVAGSPTAHLTNRKKQNRRSDVMSLFQSASPSGTSLNPITSFSAPVTPRPPSPTPAGLSVLEEEEDQSASEAEELEHKSYFGAAALDLQRKRQSAGLESLNASPPHYTPPRSPRRSGFGNVNAMQSLPPLASTIASSSRLTTVHTTRHPLSLSGLHLALQGALASKRYSCSHLLALRFNEDEDDSYWENVRSVMALLTSTFSDASARLMEALDEAEKRRIKDEHPTPPRGNTPTPQGKESRERCTSPLRHGYVPARSVAEMVSFAPMPSNMSRFAGHVDAISTALNDARDHMEECIFALRSPSIITDFEAGVPSIQEHPAFQAYDRLRKELGFALRECERGRERLLDIISPRAAMEVPDDEDLSPHTPGLKHDSGSESSERGPASPRAPVDSNHGLGITLSYGREDHDQDLDDASTHLLLGTSSQHLPLPGAEQVFESEAGTSAQFTRARSKLSREERIKAMKARRASGVPFAVPPPDVEVPEDQPQQERTGPGTEVVQELKDVIWKVGEKRRRMSQQVQLPPVRNSALGTCASIPEEPLAVDISLGGYVPVPLPERETSISIAVQDSSPVSGGDEDDQVNALQDESELAYLDSPLDPSFEPAVASSDVPLSISLDSQTDLAAAFDSIRTVVSDHDPLNVS